MQTLHTIKLYLLAAVLVATVTTGCGHHGAKDENKYPAISWSKLIPPSWDENSLTTDIDLSKMQDNDPKALALLKKVRARWNNAPVVDSLNNQTVTITGYPVPLDGNKKFMKELLLVPYFGGCIHTPPPPSNQIIHVHIKNILPIPYDDLAIFTNSYGGITVKGVLKVAHSSSLMGDAGYQMDAKIIDPIEEQATPVKE